MIALILIGGVVVIFALAIKGGIVATTDQGVVDQSITVNVPDAMASAMPSNTDGANQADVSTDFPPGVQVPINPVDRDTWPAGDAIWDVARAIAVQEGYGLTMANAPTRNNNPGDLSDGFDQFGGEALDSKITHFPDPATGWNWLYNKLKNVQTGRSKVFSNNMTWKQFGSKWATDPNWPNGVTRELGVALTDRVGDYWNA